MFRIGEFSRLARVSMRLLRYYDELGLLQPDRTNAENGYRYYSAGQLAQLNRILALRDLGLSLEQIGRALADGVSAQELRGMLLVRRADLERALQEDAQRLRLVESRIAALEAESDALPDDVIIRPEPERRYLSLRTRLPSFGDAVALVLTLLREIPPQLPRGVLGTVIGVSHSIEYEPDDLDIELGFELAREPSDTLALADGRSLSIRTLPAHAQVATCVRIGSPEQAHLATGRIGRCLEAGGYHLAGPNREIFLKLPDRDRSIQPVIEMAFPIELRGADGATAA